MDNRTIVERFVGAFGEGRLEDALEMLHKDFVVHAAGDVPYSGDYHGAEGFSTLITKMLNVMELAPSTEMRYLVDDEKVAIYYRLTFTARASAKSVEMSVAEVFSIRDDLIAELDVFYKDPSAVVALLKG